MSAVTTDEAVAAVGTERMGEHDAVQSAAGFTGNIRTHGVFTRLFNVAGVNPSSAVCVSLCELSGGTPFMGDATMKVDNVVPLANGQVRVRGEVAWGADLDVRVQFIVS